MDSCAWLIRTAEDALAQIRERPASAHEWPPPASPAEGAAEQLEAMLLIEAFGLPEPSRAPIRHRDLRL